jgi:hypothetical protein
MHLDNHCPGCGGGEGNQSCAIARCSFEHGRVEYCSQCSEFPCMKYEHIDDFDSFIIHRSRKKDFEKVEQIGISSYNAEQTEKIEILNFLLSNYNDGRRKNFFCVAVNLLELHEIKQVIKQIEENAEFNSLTLKDKSAHVVGLFQDIAKRQNVELKLRKKPSKKK